MKTTTTYFKQFARRFALIAAGVLMTSIAAWAQPTDLLVPTRSADAVFSIWSTTYGSSITGTNWQYYCSVVPSNYTVTGKDVKQLTRTTAAQGWLENGAFWHFNAVNCSGYNYLHADIYIPDDANTRTFGGLRFKLSEKSESPLNAQPLVLGAWNSFDIPTDNFSNYDPTKLNGFQVIPYTTGQNVYPTEFTIYADNVYLYNASAVVVPDAPTPSRDSTNVMSVFGSYYQQHERFNVEGGACDIFGAWSNCGTGYVPSPLSGNSRVRCNMEGSAGSNAALGVIWRPNLDNQVLIGGYENFHVDVYLEDNAVARTITALKIGFAEGTYYTTTQTLVYGAWNSFDIPCVSIKSNYDASTTTNRLLIVPIAGGETTYPASSYKMYVDHMYFYNSPAGAFIGASLGATTNTSATINLTTSGFGSAISSYQISTDAGANWTDVTSAVSGTVLSLTELTPNTAYSVLVRASDGTSTATTASPVNFTTKNPTVSLNTCTMYQAAAQVYFSLSEFSGIPATFEYSTDGGTNWSSFLSTPVLNPSTGNYGGYIPWLTPGTSYNIRVRVSSDAETNISSGVTVTSTQAISALPTAPTHDVGVVWSQFSDTYGNNANWVVRNANINNQTGGGFAPTQYTYDANNHMHRAELLGHGQSYAVAGVQYAFGTGGPNTDLSGYDSIRMDVYVPSDPISNLAQYVYLWVGGSGDRYRQATALTRDTWMTLKYALSNFPVEDFTKVKYYGVQLATVASGGTRPTGQYTILVDNIYFYKSAAQPTLALTNTATTATTATFSVTLSNFTGVPTFTASAGNCAYSGDAASGTLTISGLTQATTYNSLTVTATNNTEVANANANITTLTPSLALGAVTATTTMVSFTVTPTNIGNPNYSVTDNGTPVSSGVTIEGNTMTISGLTPGSTHNFTVTASGDGTASASTGNITTLTPSLALGKATVTATTATFAVTLTNFSGVPTFTASAGNCAYSGDAASGTLTISGLTKGTTYNPLTVTATYNTEVANADANITTLTPTVSANLVNINTTKAELEVSAQYFSGAVSYTVSTNGGTSYDATFTQLDNILTVTGLSASTSYSIKVKAVYNAEEATSASIDVITPASDEPTVTIESQTSYASSVQVVAGISGFASEITSFSYSLDGGTNYTELTVGDGNTTYSNSTLTMLIPWLTPATTYNNVMIKASNASENASAALSSFTTAAITNAPVAPNRTAGSYYSQYSSTYGNNNALLIKNSNLNNANNLAPLSYTLNDKNLHFAKFLGSQGANPAEGARYDFGTQNLSRYARIHVDVYIPGDALLTSSNVKSLYMWLGANGYRVLNTDNIQYNAWNSFDLALSDFKNGGAEYDLSALSRVGVQLGSNAAGSARVRGKYTLFIDNLYFYAVVNASLNTVGSTTATLNVSTTDFAGNNISYEYSIDGGSSFVAASVSDGVLSLSGLSAGTTYQVKVRATSNTGEHAISQAVELTTTPSAAPTPTRAQARVRSVLSTHYTVDAALANTSIFEDYSNTGTNYSPRPINLSSMLKAGMQGGGSDGSAEHNAQLGLLMRYNLDTYFDLSACDYLHVDVFVPNSATGQTIGKILFGVDENNLYTSTQTIVYDAWNSFDIATSNLTNIGNTNRLLIVPKTSGNLYPASPYELYVDNIYFYYTPKISTGSVSATHTQATISGISVSGFSDAVTYSVSTDGGANYSAASVNDGVMTVSGLTAGQNYQVRVKATCQAYSEVAISSLIAVSTLPNPTLSLSIADVSQNSVVVNVQYGNFISTPTTYLAKWNGAAEYAAATVVDGQISFSGLTKDTDYTLQMKASNASGEEAESTVLNIHTLNDDVYIVDETFKEFSNKTFDLFISNKGAVGTEAYLHCFTTADGEAKIDILPYNGDTGTQFRGNGIGIDKWTVTIDGVSSAASEYFNFSINSDKTEITLTPKENVPQGALLSVNNKYIEYQTSTTGNLYPSYTFAFHYTPGGLPATIKSNRDSIVFTGASGEQMLMLSAENLTANAVLSFTAPTGIEISPVQLQANASGILLPTAVTLKATDAYAGAGALSIQCADINNPVTIALVKGGGFSAYCENTPFMLSQGNNGTQHKANMYIEEQDDNNLLYHIAPYATGDSVNWQNLANIQLNGVLLTSGTDYTITKNASQRLLTLHFNNALQKGDVIQFGNPIVWWSNYDDHATLNKNCYINSYFSYTFGSVCEPQYGPTANLYLEASATTISCYFGSKNFGSTPNYTIKYRVKDSGVAYTEVAALASPLVLNGLTQNTEYEVVLVANKYLQTVNIHSGITTPDPEIALDADIAGSTVNLSWEPKYFTTNPSTYTLRYKQQGEAIYTEVPVSGTSYTLNNLPLLTIYNIQVEGTQGGETAVANRTITTTIPAPPAPRHLANTVISLYSSQAGFKNHETLYIQYSNTGATGLVADVLGYKIDNEHTTLMANMLGTTGANPGNGFFLLMASNRDATLNVAGKDSVHVNVFLPDNAVTQTIKGLAIGLDEDHFKYEEQLNLGQWNAFDYAVADFESFVPTAFKRFVIVPYVTRKNEGTGSPDTYPASPYYMAVDNIYFYDKTGVSISVKEARKGNYGINATIQFTAKNFDLTDAQRANIEYRLRYRAVGSGDEYTEMYPVTSPYTLKELDENLNYEVLIEAAYPNFKAAGRMYAMGSDTIEFNSKFCGEVITHLGEVNTHWDSKAGLTIEQAYTDSSDVAGEGLTITITMQSNLYLNLSNVGKEARLSATIVVDGKNNTQSSNPYKRYVAGLVDPADSVNFVAKDTLQLVYHFADYPLSDRFEMSAINWRALGNASSGSNRIPEWKTLSFYADCSSHAVARNENNQVMYQTVNSAIKNASTGDTIALFNDVNDAFEVDKEIYFKANGYRVNQITLAETGILHVMESSAANTVIQKSSYKGTGQILFEEARCRMEITNWYIDRTFAPTISSGMWYNFSMPDTVSLKTGVYFVPQGNEPMQRATIGRDFIVKRFDGQARANYGPYDSSHRPWTNMKANDGVSADTLLLPGQGYSITLTGDQSTLRFKALIPEGKNIVRLQNVGVVQLNNALSTYAPDRAPAKSVQYTNSAMTMPYKQYAKQQTITGDGDALRDGGWNFVGPMYAANTVITPEAAMTQSSFNYFQYANELGTNFGLQMKGYSSFLTLSRNENPTLAPCSSLAIQVTNNGNAAFAYGNLHGAGTVVRMADEEIMPYKLTIAQDGKPVSDNLYYTINQAASLLEYQPGFDLMKFGVNTEIAQMWSTDLGYDLSANDMLPINGMAKGNLSLHLPADDLYTLSLALSGGEPCYLLRDGNVIHNFANGDYEFVAPAGTYSNYEFQIGDGGITTDIESSDAEGQGNKTYTAYIQNGVLYVLGLEEGDRVAVYNNVQCLATGLAQSSSWSLPVQPNGVFIVTINGGNSIKLLSK